MAHIIVLSDREERICGGEKKQADRAERKAFSGQAKSRLGGEGEGGDRIPEKKKRK